jgi:hypothetical protein
MVATVDGSSSRTRNRQLFIGVDSDSGYIIKDTIPV